MRTLLPILACLALALASSCGGAVLADDGPGRVAPVVRLAVAPGVPYGAAVTVSATIENTTLEPIALLGATLTAGPRALIAMAPGVEVIASKVEGGGLALDGAYEVDDPGPAARAPLPPRWRWTGDVRVASRPVLSPGETFTVAASVRATDANAPLAATFAYAVLPRGAGLLRLTRFEVVPEPAGGTPGLGGPRQVTAARAHGLLSPSASVVDGAQPVAPPESREAAIAPPALYPYALHAEAVAGLTRATVHAGATIEIARPAFDLPAARAAGKVATGEAAYVPALRAWMLCDGAASRLVSPTAVVEVAGRACRLAEAIADAGAATVSLDRAPDPAALGAALDAAGVRVASRARKGGGKSVDARVEPATLRAFLEVLARARLRIHDLAVEGPP